MQDVIKYVYKAMLPLLIFITYNIIRQGQIKSPWQNFATDEKSCYNAEGNSCTKGAINGVSQFTHIRAIHCVVPFGHYAYRVDFFCVM